MLLGEHRSDPGYFSACIIAEWLDRASDGMGIELRMPRTAEPSSSTMSHAESASGGLGLAGSAATVTVTSGSLDAGLSSTRARWCVTTAWSGGITGSLSRSLRRDGVPLESLLFLGLTLIGH
jgi:hypothetical protein